MHSTAQWNCQFRKSRASSFVGNWIICIRETAIHYVGYWSGKLLTYETRLILANALPAPLIKHSISDEIKAGWNYTIGANGETEENQWPLDLLSPSLSVQDLFDAPAAEEEIQALLNWLNETVGKVSSQEVLASSEAHGHVPQVLSQRGGGHGLGKRALGLHCSGEGRGEIRQKQDGGQLMRTGGEVWQIGLDPAHANSWDLLRVAGTVCSSTYNLLYELRVAFVHILCFLDSSLLSNIHWLIKGLVYLRCAVFPSFVYHHSPTHSLWALTIPESAPFC